MQPNVEILCKGSAFLGLSSADDLSRRVNDASIVNPMRGLSAEISAHRRCTGRCPVTWVRSMAA